MLFRHDMGDPGKAGAGPRVIVERPPPGLARGRYAASPAAIVVLGGTLVLALLVYYFFRIRRPRP